MGAIYGYPQLGSGKNCTVPEAPMNKLHWGVIYEELSIQ